MDRICHRMLDLSAVEEMGQNESILISVHEEVVEMVEEAPTISTSHASSTLPFCKCSVAYKTSRCPCKAGGYGCHPSWCKCRTSKCTNKMKEV